MLDVETNHQIILLYFRERLSIRKIAGQLKISRDTVKARIVEYEKFKSEPDKDSSNPTSAKAQYLSKGPVYDSSGRNKRKLTEEIVEIIDACLQENETKRLEGRSKQELRKIDIHEKILSAGYVIGYTTVSEYIRERRSQVREAFIKQGYGEGSICEFDWAEVKINLGGKFRRYYLAVFTSAYSNYRYALLFQRQDSLAFKEAHICFFEHIGGVYHQMVYDNMRVAVAQFVGKTEKTPTEGLLQLSRWYQCQWRFCNTAKGNEKGHVERSVEYIRRKVFGFKEHFDSFQEANDYLQQRVAELNIRPTSTGQESPAIKLETERKGLYAHPGRMECFTAEHHRVDKYSTITFKTNKYSVPDNLVGTMVFVKIYSEWLKVYDTKGMVCDQKRLYDRYSWQIDLNHYLYTLQRKPGAVAGSVALKQAPEWLKNMYEQYFSHDSRSFVELLQYCQLNAVADDELIACVSRLHRQSPSHVMAAHVVALLGNQPEPESGVSGEPDPIAMVSMENLTELASMMNYN
jgi:transposase